MAITKATASSIAPAAKGDLVAGSATNDAAVLTVGANGTTLVADSSESVGMKWATPASGGGMTLLSTTTLSGGSTTISSINQTYNSLMFVCFNWSLSANGFARIDPNAAGGINHFVFMKGAVVTASVANVAFSKIIPLGNEDWLASDTANAIVFEVFNYANTTATVKNFQINARAKATNYVPTSVFVSGSILTTDAITSMTFESNDSATINLTGTVLMYGVK